MKGKTVTKMIAAIATATLVGLTAPALAQKALDYNNGPDPIVGTERADVLKGGTGPDRISGKSGSDWIWGNESPDVIIGGKGNDHLNGNDSGEASDTLKGGPGIDHCKATKHDVLISCEIVEIVRGLGPR